MLEDSNEAELDESVFNDDVVHVEQQPDQHPLDDSRYDSLFVNYVVQQVHIKLLPDQHLLDDSRYDSIFNYIEVQSDQRPLDNSRYDSMLSIMLYMSNYFYINI